MSGELNGLRQAQVEVVQARRANVVSACVAPTLIGAATPRCRRIGKGSGCARLVGVQPGSLCFGVGDSCTRQVRTVGGTTAQAKGDSPGVGDIERETSLEDRYTRIPPPAD